MKYPAVTDPTIIGVIINDTTNPIVHTQGIEATWGALKTSLRHLHGTNKEMLPSYLYHYMFRCFHNNNKIFQHLLEEMRVQYQL